MDINVGDDGYSPLYLAAEEGYSDIVSHLINELEADPNPCSEGHNGSPLIVAAYFGHLKVCEILIGAGASVNEVSKTYLNSLLKRASRAFVSEGIPHTSVLYPPHQIHPLGPPSEALLPILVV